MHQPKFDRNEEVWDDDEEKERGRNPYPIGPADIMNLHSDDHFREYYASIIHGRPSLLEGASSFIYGGIQGDNDSLTQVEQTVSVVPNDYIDFVNQPSINCNLNTFIKMIAMPIKRMEKVLANNPALTVAIDSYRSKLPSNDVGNWLLITLMMATVHPHPLEKTENDDQIPPGYLSVERAARMVLGPRGLIHGWKGPVPDIRRELLRSQRKLYICPRNWAPATYTDGDSSYCTESSRSDSDAESGPRGVVRNCVPATGLSDCSETSSCLSGDNNPNSRLNVFESGGPVDNNERKSMKRFFSFMAHSNSERRERRIVRRVRRKARESNIHDSIDSALYITAKHNEKDAVKLTRNKQNQKKRIEAHNRKIRKWQRDIYRITHNITPRNQEQVEKEEDLNPELELPDNSEFHFKRLRLALREQVSKKWLRFCDPGNDIEEINRMQFHCWMTPVRWIKQSGPK